MNLQTKTTATANLKLTNSIIKNISELKLEAQRNLAFYDKSQARIKKEISTLKTQAEKQINNNKDYKNDKQRKIALIELLAKDHYLTDSINDLETLSEKSQSLDFIIREYRIELEYQRNFLEILKLEVQEQKELALITA